MPHNENIFVHQNFGCTYKDIPKQVHLSQPIWYLMMKAAKSQNLMFTSFGKINEGVTVVIMDYFQLVYTQETY